MKFAKGVLAGKHKDLAVFTGLVEAMVTKVDDDEQGIGLQNFYYPPAYDKFVHIIKAHSPQAHYFLSKHLPAHTKHSYR